MNRVFPKPGILVLTAGISAAAFAHPGHFLTAFHAHSIPEAMKLAKQEAKLIFVYATEAEGRGCPYFRWPTPQTRPMIDLLVREMIIVEQSREVHGATLAPFAIEEWPAILVLEENGQERLRLSGRLPAAAVESRLRVLLSQADAVERARLALDLKGEQDFVSRERLASALARTGDVAGAVEHYRWCMEECGQAANQAAAARRRFFFEHFAREAILQAAEGRNKLLKTLGAGRAELEAVLMGARGEAVLARDLGELNRCLGQDERSLELFDKLPADALARHGLFDFVFDQLVQRQRYEDALAFIDPLASFEGEVELCRERAVDRAAPTDVEDGRGSRPYALSRGMKLMESLAGMGRDAEAAELMKSILAFDATLPTREMARRCLDRAGRPELSRRLDNGEE